MIKLKNILVEQASATTDRDENLNQAMARLFNSVIPQINGSFISQKIGSEYETFKITGLYFDNASRDKNSIKMPGTYGYSRFEATLVHDNGLLSVTFGNIKNNGYYLDKINFISYTYKDKQGKEQTFSQSGDEISAGTRLYKTLMPTAGKPNSGLTFMSYLKPWSLFDAITKKLNTLPNSKWTVTKGKKWNICSWRQIRKYPKTKLDPEYWTQFDIEIDPSFFFRKTGKIAAGKMRGSFLEPVVDVCISGKGDCTILMAKLQTNKNEEAVVQDVYNNISTYWNAVQDDNKKITFRKN